MSQMETCRTRIVEACASLKDTLARTAALMPEEPAERLAKTMQRARETMTRLTELRSQQERLFRDHLLGADNEGERSEVSIKLIEADRDANRAAYEAQAATAAFEKIKDGHASETARLLEERAAAWHEALRRVGDIVAVEYGESLDHSCDLLHELMSTATLMNWFAAVGSGRLEKVIFAPKARLDVPVVAPFGSFDTPTVRLEAGDEIKMTDARQRLEERLSRFDFPEIPRDSTAKGRVRKGRK